MRTITTLVLGVLFLSFMARSNAARAEGDRATTKEAERMVHSAIDYLKKNGKEKALEAFSDPKGPFTYRDLYVAVYDMTGKCVAHGAKKDRIGKDMIDDKDADGKLFVRERLEIAKKQGKGWQEYKFQNPTNKKVEQKVAYIERFEDLVLICGAYKS
jgi:signal transduction histidine kinase